MADLSDVTSTLKTIIANVLYPTQPTTNVQKSPTAGVPVRIQVGWPSPGSVTADSESGKSSVSIYPLPGERNTTRYPKEWRQIASLTPPTFTLTRSGQQIAVAGAPPPTYFAQNFALILNQKAYIVTSAADSSAGSIVAALLALIQADIPGATRSGLTVVLPNAVSIDAMRVGTGATVGKELRRQNRLIQIMTLSPNALDRDAVVKVFDPVLADTPRFVLPDGYGARLIYHDSPVNDFDQKFGVFRRDLRYDVEYPTVATITAPEAIAIEAKTSQIARDGSTIAPPISDRTF